MSADALLSRFDGVRRTGDGRWIALCPAHEDRSPSLSIRELGDGRILLHCFSGCAVEEILAAVDLTFSDLFPEKPSEHAEKVRIPFLPSDVFEIAREEIGVAAVIACDMQADRTISDTDHERLLTAVERLDDIARCAYGR